MQYAKPELLAETDWLADHLNDPGIAVVDCEELNAYLRIHVEGAVGLRTHHYLKDRNDPSFGTGVHVMPPEQFERVMSGHGVSNDSLVVAYDSMGGLYAARLWWTLRYYGHTNCKVLNGGFRKWYEEGRPVSLDQPHVEWTQFKTQPPRTEICATRAQVESAIDDNGTIIWDVRAHTEYTGDDPRQNKRGGHIPSARNLEWLDLTAPPTRSGLLLPAEEIEQKLQAAGVTPDKHVITHCQAGIRAAFGMFVLDLMGYPSVASYDASWNEWGNLDDTPVVQGE